MIVHIQHTLPAGSQQSRDGACQHLHGPTRLEDVRGSTGFAISPGDVHRGRPDKPHNGFECLSAGGA